MKEFCLAAVSCTAYSPAMTASLNILFVESGTTGGGSFESLYQMLRLIDRSRFTPIVCFINPTRYLNLFRDMGIKTFLFTDLVYTQKIPKFIRSNLERRVDRGFLQKPQFADAVVSLGHGYLISQLCSLVKREQVDVLYCNDQIKRDIFGCYVARKMGIPMISHLRSLDGKTFVDAKADFANKWVDAYIANSNFVAKYWIGQGAQREKVHVVFNAVEETAYKPVDIRSELSIPNNKKILLCMARLVGFKGHPFLLKAFAQLLKEDDSVILLIAGEGNDREMLEGLTRSLGLVEHVVFLGHDPRGPELIAGADALVLPSNKEPFGRVLIEAMRVGVPVIGTNLGGVPDIIEHEDNGLMVDYGDEDGLCQAMIRLLTDDELRERCTRNGLQAVSNKFNLIECTRDIEKIIECVAAKAKQAQEN
jgi:glycosyltransferase involved in cell wall biosynthesis